MTFLTQSDVLVQIASGNIAGEIIHKFGRNPDVDSGTTPEDIWVTGGLMNWETVPNVVSIVSTSVNDDGSPSGTGANSITIVGCDSTFTQIEETVTLNGLTPVVTTNSFIRTDRAFIASTGTYHGSNEGIITATINGNTTFTMELGTGQTELGRFTVPVGKIALVLSAFVSVDSTKPANVSLHQKTNADDVVAPFSGAERLVWKFDMLSGEDLITPRSPVFFDEKVDMWWRCDFASSNGTGIDVNFEILLTDKPVV